MKILLLISLFYVAACGSSSKKNNRVIIGTSEEVTQPISEVNKPPTETSTLTPNGAATGNFYKDRVEFYGYVANVDINKGITTISFQDNIAPSIRLEERYGATLSTLRFKEFNSDLLLVDTKINDPQFHKYHLYILKNNQWLPVVNPFAIHESHKEAQQNPIIVDPDNPNNMFRYYSVFDIDDTNETGYGWRLHNESIPILNK